MLVSDALVAMDPHAPALAGLVEATPLFEVRRRLEDWPEPPIAGLETSPFFDHLPVALELLHAGLGECSEFAGMGAEDMLTCLIQQCGELPYASLWQLAWRDGVACGLVLPTVSSFGTIMALAVRPDCRGRGLGRALHAHALSLLKRSGAAAYLDHIDARSIAMNAICTAHGCEIGNAMWQYRYRPS